MKLSVKDAAQMLDVTEKTVYRWIKQESIPCYRINEQYRFNRSVGLFADSRYFYGNNGLSETLTRAGLRFIF